MKRFPLIISILFLLFSTSNTVAAEVTHTTTNKIVHQQVQKKSLVGRVKAWFTSNEISEEEKAVILNKRKEKKMIMLKRRREKAKEAEETGTEATGETGETQQKAEKGEKASTDAGKKITPAQTNQPVGGSSGKGTAQSTQGLK